MASAFAQAWAQPAPPPASTAAATASTLSAPDFNPLAALTNQEREAVEQAIGRALAFLASQQEPDGGFPTYETGRPGVTALCGLAFLANGHTPESKKYGPVVKQAINFVLAHQQPDGLFSTSPPEPVMNGYYYSHTANYNHPLAGLLLSEAYGMTDPATAARLRPAIEAALTYTTREQRKPKANPAEVGGWRYSRPWIDGDADLSVTSWNLMFLRSCRNAGFAVPAGPIDQAMGFVKRCFDPGAQTFYYGFTGNGHHITRAMAGAGILALSLGGEHNSEMAQTAGGWLLGQGFDEYNQPQRLHDRYHYSVFYATVAMFQLGEKFWRPFFPRLVRVLLANQAEDGSWAPESAQDGNFGNAYTTALVVLALSTPNQLLPIFQR